MKFGFKRRKRRKEGGRGKSGRRRGGIMKIFNEIEITTSISNNRIIDSSKSGNKGGVEDEVAGFEVNIKKLELFMGI
jgi:hypothetical protein